MVADASPPTETPKKPKQKRINYALAGVLVGQGVTLANAAVATGAANSESLRRGLARKGVTASKARAQSPQNAVTATVTAKLVTEATEYLREQANGLLGAQIGQLARKAPGKLANRGQGEAGVLESLSRTWRNLNGNPDSIVVAFGVGRDPGSLLAGPKAQPVVECPPEPAPAQSTPCVDVQESQ